MVITSKLFILIAAITTATAYNPTENEEVVKAIITRRSVETDECELFGLCEVDDSYPEDLADNLIAELGNLKNLLTMDELDESEVANRRGSSGTDKDLCPSTKKLYYPRTGKDRKGKKHSILNKKSKPLQAVLVHICKSGATYRDDIVKFQPGWEGKCIQKFFYRSMLTIDSIGKAVSRAEIKVPYSCSCVGYPAE